MRLRSRLIGILLAMLVPTILVVVALGLSERASDEQRLAIVESRQLDLRRQTIEQMLRDAERELELLAHTPSVVDGAWDAAHVQLKTMSRFAPEYTYVSVSDSSGRVQATSQGVSGADVSRRPWFVRALSTRSPVIGTFEMSAVSNIACLPVAVPVLGANGEVTAIVFLDLPVTVMAQHIGEVKPPSGNVLVVLDTEGQLLVRLPELPAIDHGERVEGELVDAMLSRQQGSSDVRGLDGHVRRYTFGTVAADPVAPIHVAVGYDETVVLREGRRQMVLAGLVLGLVWLGAAGTGYLGLLRWVLLPVDRLGRTADRLSEGESSARVGEVGGTQEFVSLGRQFDHMAESLERTLDDQRTRRARVEALHGVMEAAVSSIGLASTAQRILDYLVEHHGFELANLWLAKGDTLELVASRGYPPSYAERYSPMPLTAPYDAASVYTSGVPNVLSEALNANPAVVRMYESIGVKLGAYIIVPVVSLGTVIGTLHFGWHERHPMNEHDVSFYASIGSEVGVVLENARLYENERRIADRLQEALLAMPETLAGVEYAHTYHSATEEARVGGDFYDLFEIEHGRIGITIGDVAGKGLESAAMTSLVKNAVRAHASESGSTPGHVLYRANEVVYRSTPPESFVTVFFGILDTTDGRLVFASAGHTTGVLVMSDGSLVHLPATGTVLGAFPSVTFDEGEAQLAEGRVLFLYTDGLTEARAEQGFFGEERLFDLLAHLGTDDPQQVVGAVVDTVLTFVNEQLSDDLAVLALRLQ